MATASKKLAAGKSQARQSGNGGDGQFELKAKLAAGVAVLGCVAALVFGGLRAGESAQTPSVAPAASAAQAGSRERQLFLERNTVLPGGGTISPLSYGQLRFLEEKLSLPSMGADFLFAADQFTYREDRRVGLPTVTAPVLDWATILLIEQNQLPEITSAPPGMCQPGELGGCDR